MTENITKCGFVTLAGRPNVGKSTLLNHILGQKVSIVTHKPQTTRDRILAIHNTQDAQIIFIDTPGIHRPVGSLGKYMNETAHNAIQEGDVCLWLIDAACKSRVADGLTDAERAIANRIKSLNIKTIAAVNKTDLVKPKHKLLPILEELGRFSFLEEIIPICAKTGEDVDSILNKLMEFLPENPKMYPEDMLSDKADRFFVAELVREAILNIAHKEVPYKTAVVIDSFKQLRKSCEIFASIHVETKGQKGILIGKHGEMIKQIRELAHKEAEILLECPVKLQLHVNISPDWSTNPAGLKKMGYE